MKKDNYFWEYFVIFMLFLSYGGIIVYVNHLPCFPVEIYDYLVHNQNKIPDLNFQTSSDYCILH